MHSSKTRPSPQVIHVIHALLNRHHRFMMFLTILGIVIGLAGLIVGIVSLTLH